MFKFICRFIFKLTGIPSLFLLLRQRYYVEDTINKSLKVKGKAILISNHTHIMDFFVMVFAHPFRKQRFLVSEAIFQHPILAILCKIMDCIMIHRERSDLSFMGEAERTLNKGGVVTIFPEGHLVHDGKIDVFKPSAIYLALRTGAPIIPHYIEPHYFSIKRTRIIMGKPIYVQEYCKSNNPSPDEVRMLCEMLRNKTKELKRKLSLYKKYKTQDVIYPKSWFLDLAKIFIFIPNMIVFPYKFHYVGNASYKDRHIKGRGIIVSKHRGFNDAPILAMHYYSRRVHIIVANELYGVLGWFLKHLLCISYNRTNDVSDPNCFLETINTLKAEGVIGIYPEGHIKQNNEGEFHEGAAYFALTTNSPIYLYYMMKENKIFHRNHIMIGETIYPDKLFNPEQMKNKESISLLTNILKERFSELKNAGQKYIKSTKN